MKLRLAHRGAPCGMLCAGLSDDPSLDGSPVALEVRADFDDLFVAGFVRDRIALVVDLFKCLFGGSVELEFKKIYCIFGFDECVAAACGAALLRADAKLRYKRKNEIEYRFIVVFILFFGIVGNAAKERPHELHGFINIAVVQRRYEFNNKRIVF